MHLRTHTKPESVGQAGRWQSPYHDTMIDHDKNVGQLLDLLDELGIADDTIVIYSTDNGPHMNTWPDGGTTPFRSEKNTNWEGAFRVPEMIRWPGHIPAGVVSNEIVQHHDWLPTFLAAAGEPDVVEKLKQGHQIGDKTFKVHIDGYNLLPYLTGEVDKSPRKGLIYFSDDGDVLGVRFDNWKIVFMEQRVPGHAADLGRAVHAAAGAEDVQPAHRSVRARRHHVEHLLRLVHRPRLPDLLRHVDHHPVPGDLQGVPAPAGAGIFTIDQAVEKLHAFLAGTEGMTEGLTLLERRGDEVGDHRLRRPGDRRGRSATTSSRAARVAVFDNDGTLWCEKPMPIQLDFTVRRLGELAADDPTLRDQQPYKAAYENDLHWMGAAMVKHYHGDDSDLKLLMGAVTSAFESVTRRGLRPAGARLLRRRPTTRR